MSSKIVCKGRGNNGIFGDKKSLSLTSSILKDVSLASKNGTVSDKLQHLAHSMVNHLVSSRSDNTIKNYFSAFKKWQTFANSENLKAIPAEPIHVALFLTDLMNNGKSVNVIQHVAYGSKWAHKLRGVSDPTNNHYRCWKRHGRWRSDIGKDSYIEDSIEKRLEVTRELHL
ncbi:hypothetical protein KUTeg_016741 [Tegillarca granosa]|uniref:Core-binding (CB) domain-containing protein n=1 Tax=Tegillarca granosa TaxID=220873 RepID=A0ABQ9EPC8_TEGGR|nr:hypothetical protein KUTeg_016741 [Tegillarca granosa]